MKSKKPIVADHPFRKLSSILAGLATPGVLGWIWIWFGESGWRWIQTTATSLLASGGGFARSWPWAVCLLIAIAGFGIFILIFVGSHIWKRFPKTVPLWIGFMPVCVLMFGLSIHTPGAEPAAFIWSCMIALIVAFSIWPSSQQDSGMPDERLEDGLHREFFSTKICKHLKSNNPHLRRIAVFGSWGEGKTFLLRLIQQELQDSKDPEFVTAWVNPWKARNPEEAWGILASGFDVALRDSMLLPPRWHRNLWVRLLAKTFPYPSIGNSLLEALESSFPTEGPSFLRRIDQKMAGILKDRRMVIFVDDMERADPLVVRSILPVIDQLSELQKCNFVFAIDDKMMEDAFVGNTRPPPVAESSDSRPESKRSHDAREKVVGYLDKVMDLQLRLPEATPLEIQKWAGQLMEEISPSCPKLNICFSKLVDFLPSNPRALKKFLNLAERTEILFLDDYRPTDHNYYALFLVLIADSEFPGLRRELSNTPKWFDLLRTIRRSDDIGSSRNEKIQSLADDLGRVLAVPESRREELKRILEELCRQITFLAIERDYPNVDLEWLTTGFEKRLHLPTSKMEHVARQWRMDAGKRSLPDVLVKAIPNDVDQPSHVAETLQQILEMEMDRVKNLLRNVPGRFRKGGGLAPILEEAIDILDMFSTHFTKRLGKFTEDEEAILTPDLVTSFVDLIGQVPIGANESEIWRKVRVARIEAASAVACAIPWDRKRDVSLEKWDARDFEHIENSKRKDDAYGELAEIRNRFKDHLVSEFVNRVKNAVESSTPRPVIGPDSPTSVLEPDRWIPLRGGQFDLKQLNRLESIAMKNDAAHRWICDAVEILLYNSTDEILGRFLVSDRNRYRRYLRRFWTSAISRKIKSHRDRVEEIIDLRNKLYEDSAELEPDLSDTPPQSADSKQPTKQQIEEAFPALLNIEITQPEMGV